MSRHPRERFITVFGRKPVLEVLERRDVEVAKVFLAHGAKGSIVHVIREAAKARGVPVQRESRERVSRISRRPKQDQGVAADVEAPAMMSVEGWLAELEGDAIVLALDHVTTPANVGMILRTATVLGLGGVLLPRRGSPEIGPLVIKASAGVAFRSRVLRCATIEEGLAALKEADFRVIGLSARGESLVTGTAAPRSVWVLGNETDGVVAAASYVDDWVRIPMASSGDSLNVACAAAVAAWEAVRGRSA